jgi:hypothetical protein
MLRITYGRPPEEMSKTLPGSPRNGGKRTVSATKGTAMASDNKATVDDAYTAAGEARCEQISILSNSELNLAQLLLAVGRYCSSALPFRMRSIGSTWIDIPMSRL